MQATLFSSPPLSPEEWVCIADWYSDEEQSVSDIVQTDGEAQPDSAASRSVCLILPSIDTAASTDTVPGLTASQPCIVSPALPSATAAALQSAAHPLAAFTSQHTTSAASAQQFAFLAVQSVNLATLVARPTSLVVSPIMQSAPPTMQPPASINRALWWAHMASTIALSALPLGSHAHPAISFPD